MVSELEKEEERLCYNWMILQKLQSQFKEEEERKGRRMGESEEKKQERKGNIERK